MISKDKPLTQYKPGNLVYLFSSQTSLLKTIRSLGLFIYNQILSGLRPYMWSFVGGSILLTLFNFTDLMFYEIMQLHQVPGQSDLRLTKPGVFCLITLLVR